MRSHTLKKSIAQKVELEWAQNQMHMRVTPINFLKEILGAKDLHVQIIGKAVTAETLTDEQSKEVHRRLGLLVDERKKALRRRRGHRFVVRGSCVLPIIMSILCCHAGLC